MASSKKLDQATELLMAAKQGAKPKDGLLYDEMLVGCEGARLNNSIALFWLEKSGKSKSKDKINAYELSDSIRKFEHRFRAVWHKRNRPSDFWRVSQKLLDLAEQIDRLK